MADRLSRRCPFLLLPEALALAGEQQRQAGHGISRQNCGQKVRQMQSVSLVKAGLLTALLAVFLLLPPSAGAQAPAPVSSPAVDKLGRDNPQSSVTAFLQACRRQDYNLASQYIDLRFFSDKSRQQQGTEVAKRLEAALNSAPHFDAIDLSRSPQGSSDDSGQSGREVIATLNESGQSYTLGLERVVLQTGGPQVWIFSPGTVVSVLNLKVSTTAPWLVHYLPGFQKSVEFLETPIWK